jgi:hypothetical protein
MASSHDQAQQSQGIDRRRLVLILLGVLLFLALFLFLLAGTWAWEKGWLFILVLPTSGR